jgi:hypothetical protein
MAVAAAAEVAADRENWTTTYRCPVFLFSFGAYSIDSAMIRV